MPMIPSGPVPVNLRGLGAGWSSEIPSSSQCGNNPCSWFDNVYLSSDCVNFLRCADPTNSLVTRADEGILQAIGQTAGGMVGGTVGNFGGSLASSAGESFWDSLGDHGPAGAVGGGLIVVAAIAIAAFVLLKR